jgi:hypothetical protein
MCFQNSSCPKWSLAFLSYIFFKIDKTLRLFLPHGFFFLPCCIFKTIEAPLNLSKPTNLFLRTLNFRSRMCTGSIHKFSLCSIWTIVQSIVWLELDTYFFNNDIINTLCTLIDAGNTSMYATDPIFSKISKGLNYLATNFGKLPNLSELHFAFTFKNTCFSTLKCLKTLLFYA